MAVLREYAFHQKAEDGETKVFRRIMIKSEPDDTYVVRVANSESGAKGSFAVVQEFPEDNTFATKEGAFVRGEELAATFTSAGWIPGV